MFVRRVMSEQCNCQHRLNGYLGPLISSDCEAHITGPESMLQYVLNSFFVFSVVSNDYIIEPGQFSRKRNRKKGYTVRWST